VKNEDGVGGIGVEFSEGFIGDAHVRNVIVVFCGAGAHVAKLSLAQVITIAPGSSYRRSPAQRRL
jgi:hypothetical protein